MNEKLSLKREWFGLEAIQAIDRWTMGSSGIYYNFDASPNFYSDCRLVSLRGGQGNAAGDYGDLNVFSNKVNHEVGLPKKWVFDHFLEAAGDPHLTDPWEIFDNHYMQWRYRLHYGRPSALATNWAINVDPLINPYFDAANMRLSREQRYEGRLSVDIIAAFDPNFLDIQFSSKGSKIDAAFIADSPFYPLGIGNFSRSSLSAFYKDSFGHSTPQQTRNEVQFFREECLSFMEMKIKESYFYREQIDKNTNYNFSRDLHESKFSIDFIKSNLNQFSKLFLMCNSLKI